MSRLKKLCALLFVIPFVLFALSCKKGGERAAVESGKAPDFTLTDLKGNAIKLSELRGKVVLLEFWATWCPPCRESIPELNKVSEKFRNRDFQLLGIAVDKGGDALSKVRDFVREQAVLYPVMLDDGDVNVSYEVSSIPVMFVIDREGKVVKRHMGFVPGLAETLSKEIEGLL